MHLDKVCLFGNLRFVVVGFGQFEVLNRHLREQLGIVKLMSIFDVGYMNTFLHILFSFNNSPKQSIDL